VLVDSCLNSFAHECFSVFMSFQHKSISNLSQAARQRFSWRSTEPHPGCCETVLAESGARVLLHSWSSCNNIALFRKPDTHSNVPERCVELNALRRGTCTLHPAFRHDDRQADERPGKGQTTQASTSSRWRGLCR